MPFSEAPLEEGVKEVMRKEGFLLPPHLAYFFGGFISGEYWGLREEVTSHLVPHALPGVAIFQLFSLCAIPGLH